MSPDRDPGRREDEPPEVDEYEESPRSIFSALWFRALLAVLVLGVLAAVAVPYVLDLATTPALKNATAKPAPLASASVVAPTAAPAPAVAPAEATGAPSPSPSPVIAPTPAQSSPPPAVPKSSARVAKAVDAARPTPKAAAAVKPTATKGPSDTSGGGPYWVQVGAFKDAETAKRLVARLREQGLRAEPSTFSVAGSRPPVAPAAETSSDDRYDVVVAGASAADVDAKLASKGLTGETTTNGIAVRPSLPLRDAVALSRDLADAGLVVQVRRIGAPALVAKAETAEVFHRVRVGGFPDRAAALTAMKHLEDKGFKPFIGRGNE